MARSLPSTELWTDHVAQSTAFREATFGIVGPLDIKVVTSWRHLGHIGISTINLVAIDFIWKKNWKSNGRIISGKDGKKKILEATRQMTWPLGSSHGFWMIEAQIGLYPRPVMVPILYIYIYINWVSNLGLWLVARLVQWQPKLSLFLLFLVDAAASISLMVSYSCSW